jgi:hypothetical protein
MTNERRTTARHYRSLGLICRQQAVFHPEASWKWLGEAERWENLAAAKESSERILPSDPDELSREMADNTPRAA